MTDVVSRQPEMEDTLDRMAAARNYNAWLLERARPYLGSSVLDLGAGTGTFSELIARDADVVALEPDERLARVLRERTSHLPRMRVVEGGAEVLGGIDGRFDSILCLNVLEHVEDEAGTLAGCFERLRSGGHLLLLVPAHPALFGAVDALTGHVRRYGAAHLRAELARAGFEIVDLRHVNPVGALGWLVFSKLLRRDQVPRGPLAGYDRLVPLLRQLDRLRLPFGLSLWAVANRPSTSS
jgi:SAM-dependent methyltransferase